MNNTEKPLVGDRVEYLSYSWPNSLDCPGIIAGILAEVWVSTISGKGRARIVDFPSEIEDEEAGKAIDFDRIRKPQETTQ